MAWHLSTGEARGPGGGESCGVCALPWAGGAEVVPLRGERGVKVDGAEEEAAKAWGESLWGGEQTLPNVNVRTT